jgi:hypothetical protein
MNTKRRAAAVGIGGVVAVAAIAAGFAIANNGGSAAPNRGSSAFTGVSSALIPATPLIGAVVSPGQTPVSSSAFKVDPSSNAAASDVTHYEVWRRDESMKGVPWQVVGNIQANLMSKGHVYTDLHEQPGHKYSFRVVAVSATNRSQYMEIQIVAQQWW